MRRKKNIILNLRNTTSHFTGKAKIITLVLAIIMLSFANMTLCSSNIFSNSNVSALDYSSNVGIGFTFNPTLSINISSSDLVISNLKPGTTEDSNSINVSVATNATYGYTLSANVNDENLVHSNSNNDSNANTGNSIGNNLSSNVFSSIATNANLASLDDSEDTNIWGYSYKNNIASNPTWSNYSGLSNSVNKVLFNTDSNTSSSIDFKIAAKANNTQPSGVYTGTINFYATTKPTPITLSEAYASEDKTMVNGYYTMQDMTSTICNKTEAIGAQLQVLDIRDYNDLDLSHNRPLTSEDTDLNDGSLSGAYAENYMHDSETKIIIWVPKNTTGTWGNSYNTAYSIDPGNWYWDGNYETPTCDYLTTICEDFSQTPYDGIGTHGHVGNYYNWSAAIASDNSGSLDYNTYDNVANNPKNSICPKNWRLPTTSSHVYDIQNSTNEFLRLRLLYNSNSSRNDSGLIIAPVYFARFGRTGNYSSNLVNPGSSNFYYSSTIYGNARAYSFYNMHSSAGQEHSLRSYGTPLRCLAR